MATDQLVEQRLAALEQAVADLSERVPPPPPRADWIRRITGSVSDAAAFAEALEHGRTFRHSDRTAERTETGG